MPRGDKSSYTDKQKRQAQYIEAGYEKRGIDKSEAEHRAWATVNKETHGGKKMMKKFTVLLTVGLATGFFIFAHHAFAAGASSAGPDSASGAGMGSSASVGAGGYAPTGPRMSSDIGSNPAIDSGANTTPSMTNPTNTSNVNANSSTGSQTGYGQGTTRYNNPTRNITSGNAITPTINNSTSGAAGTTGSTLAR